MFRVALPLGIALASACSLPLAATAIPINPADGVSTSVPNGQPGPRRPGMLRPAPLAEDAATPYANRRGRSVPSASKGLNAGEQPGRVAESVPRPAPREL